MKKIRMRLLAFEDGKNLKIHRCINNSMIGSFKLTVDQFVFMAATLGIIFNLFLIAFHALYFG